MPTLTITASATITTDGTLVNVGATNFQADVRWFNQITKNVSNTYDTVLSAGGFLFALIENKGSDTVIVRMQTSGGDYIRFSIPAGGHAFLPGRTAVEGLDISGSGSLAIRSKTSTGSRVVVHIGGGWTNA